MNVSDYSMALLRGDFKEACKIRQESIPPKLYKFFPLDVSEEKDLRILNTLKAGELWFSPISSFNDPYEYMGLFIKEERLKQAGYDDALIAAINKTLTTIGGQGLVCCFSATDCCAAPMWAYYANWAKGFCVEYDVISPCAIREVLYESAPLDVTGIVARLLKSAIDKGLKGSFSIDDKISIELLSTNTCIKHKSWEHEQEYRIVLPVEEGKGCSLPVASSGLKTNRIILGLRCSHDKEIIEIADRLGVRVSKLYKTKESYFAEENQLQTIHINEK